MRTLNFIYPFNSLFSEQTKKI